MAEQQPSVTSDQLSSLTDSIEALKKENLQQKEDFELLLDEHKTIVHNEMLEGDAASDSLGGGPGKP